MSESVLVRRQVVELYSLRSGDPNRHHDDARDANGCDDDVRDDDASGIHRDGGLSHG